MVIPLLLSLALSLPAGSGLPQATEKKQERKDPEAKLPKRGDIVLARGCIRGGVLESGSLSTPGGGDYIDLLTYRLTGEKETLEEIKKEHDGHDDVITGELRTDLPKATRGRTIGNTRITIGVGPGRGNMPEPPPPMPVLKVTDFEHTGVTCR
jgi:hypothetical protein